MRKITHIEQNDDSIVIHIDLLTSKDVEDDLLATHSIVLPDRFIPKPVQQEIAVRLASVNSFIRPDDLNHQSDE